LRDDPGEAWIRTYTRWLFIGLIPAAIMLLAAFWKRVLPYGLTELRLLGVLLGVWLLAIAVHYTLRPGAGIRRIPVTLAALLLLTLYGPLSVTTLSISSQGRRLARLVAAHRRGEPSDKEASAALRFLLEHGARPQVAAAIPGELPRVPWDSLARGKANENEIATRILALAGMQYTTEYQARPESYLYLYAMEDPVMPIGGYDWILSVSSGMTAPLAAGEDSVRTRFDSSSGIVVVRVGQDSLRFDVGRLADSVWRDRSTPASSVPAERLRLAAYSETRRGLLALQSVNGRRTDQSIGVDRWNGKLLLGKP